MKLNIIMHNYKFDIENKELSHQETSKQDSSKNYLQ